MNDFEIFSSNEQAEGLDPAAFEEFKEKLKENAKQGKKDEKREKKQRVQDEALFSIIKQVINELGFKHPLAVALVDCLKSNIPSYLLVPAISLNFKSIQKMSGLKFMNNDSEFTPGAKLKLFDSTLPEFVKFNIATYLTAVKSAINEDLAWTKQKFTEYKDAEFYYTELVSLVIQEYMQINKLDFNASNILEFVRVYINDKLNPKQNELNTRNNQGS